MRRAGKWFGGNIAAALVAIGLEKLLGLVGGAALLAILPNLYSKLRGVPQDWYITGAIFIGALLLIALSIFLTRRKNVKSQNETSPVAETSQSQQAAAEFISEISRLTEANANLGRNLEEEIASLKSQLTERTKHKLSFEIDGSQTQVRLSGSATVRRIEASVRLRCFKTSAGAMAVREFQASLHTEGSKGEQAITGRVNAARAWLFPMKTLDPTIDITNGLIVNDPISPYYWFFFYLDLSPQVADGLSREHFLRITMNAVGQEPHFIDFYVNSWADARSSNSDVNLRNAPVALIIDNAQNSDCPDNWLHQIAEYEASAIHRAVSISTGGLLHKGMGGSAPYINFNFWVRNCSVFPIALESVDGYVKCVTAPIGKRLEVDNTQSTFTDECPHNSSRSLVIRVWLLQDDIAIIKNTTNIYFKFDELKIKIKGGKRCPDILVQRLDIDWVMDINGNATPWRN